jgi:membrane protein implicated in regulation of membrane protease activity
VERSTVVAVVVIFLLGLVAGLALAEFLVSATVAVGVTVIVVIVALVAYLLIRRWVRSKRQRSARLGESRPAE